MPKTGNVDNSYPTRLKTNNKITLLEPFSGAKKHHKMQCDVCSHKWKATPISKIQTYKKYGVSGCPKCNRKTKLEKNSNIREKTILELKNRNIIVLTKNVTSFHTTKRKIKFKNLECGHEFSTLPGNIVSGRGSCTVCGIEKRASVVTSWSKANSARWRETATEWKLYKSDVSKLTRSNYNKYKKQINPKNLPRGLAGVEGSYHVDHIVPIRYCFDNNIPIDICASPANLQMLSWRDNVGSRHYLKGSIPPLFQKYINTSDKVENCICTLQSIFPDSERYFQIGNTISTIFDTNTKHAVLVLPIDDTHANMKTGIRALEDFETAEVNYSIIFEDEFNKPNILKSKLLHYTHQANLPKIYARKCEIRQVDSTIKKVFLNDNHIQGNDNATIAYGAFHDDQLVAVMTFTTPRVAVGHKNKEGYNQVFELSRFATNINCRVVGIAGKLLSHFKKNHNWKQIYSYADRRWSLGNMYKQLGFSLTTVNPPDYYYIVDGKRMHRWNYRKDILKNTFERYDPKLTEYDNMVNAGFYRVWGCGTLKFVVENEQ